MPHLVGYAFELLGFLMAAHAFMIGIIRSRSGDVKWAVDFFSVVVALVFLCVLLVSCRFSSILVASSPCVLVRPRSGLPRRGWLIASPLIIAPYAHFQGFYCAFDGVWG